MASRTEPPALPARPSGPGRARWQGAATGLVAILVVAVPTMVVAEDWRGRPMIDQAGAWWLVPAALAVAAYLAGGALSARGLSRRGLPPRRIAALGIGALVGGLASVVLVAADGVRRLLFNPSLPSGVVHYWLEAAAVGVVAGALGAAAWAAVASRRRAVAEPDAWDGRQRPTP